MAFLLYVSVDTFEGKSNLPWRKLKGKGQLPPMTIEVIFGGMQHLGGLSDTE
jgi:hypothetical protein